MDKDFIFMTDDSCDLPRQWLSDKNIPVIQLSYSIDGVSYRAYDRTPTEFYDSLREGKMPVTAQLNPEQVREFMLPFLSAGKDVLYAAFSSGLSGSCGSAMMAAKDLSEEYPDRTITVVDSLAASMGQGLLVYKLQKLREGGASMQEMAKWAEENRDLVVHIFTVDDLMHLHRGGRVSKLSAVAGSMLGIKPVLHLDVDGKLKVIDKARGRKGSLTALAAKAKECVGNAANDFFMISHADSEADAKTVADIVGRELGIKDYMINYIGPVIGSHTGLGCIALFMMGEKKKP
ncbi:MAG: DegV family protein [Oscillospiraceae bacterium]|nr:DegV family protein [Oscillospiraceae bacterium]